MGYCVVSPDTLKNDKRAITVKTVFATLAEAEEHKAQCDKFDEVAKRPKRSYIVEVEENEPSKTFVNIILSSRQRQEPLSSSSIFFSFAMASSASSLFLAAHMMVLSPAMQPTISLQFISSSAAAAAIAIPETVLITRRF